MRVIFLDVDGVINNHSKRNTLSFAKLERLINACDLTGSKIVISSHWRLIQPLYSHLTAVLRYLGAEVIGSTPVHTPSAPERPCEIVEWLQSYNDACAGLDRPHVSQFVVIDDRDLLHEACGERLEGRMVRTPYGPGLCEEHVAQIIDIFGSADGSLPAVPGLPAEPAACCVPRGQFGEVRLKRAPGEPLAKGANLQKYGCTLATRCAWSGSPVGVGNGQGKRPVPWIVATDKGRGSSSKRWAYTSSAEQFAQTGRLGGQVVPIPDAVGSAGSTDGGGGGYLNSSLKKSSTLCEWLRSTVVLGGKLGQGNFGTVYLGYLLDLDYLRQRQGNLGYLVAPGSSSAVAVKLAPADDAIRDEARLLAKLHHPHITQLVASFEDGSGSQMIYLVLELCEGPTLQAVLDARGALEESEARRLFAQLVDALCYLRKQSIIHRDVKPTNCMLKQPLDDLHSSPLTNAHLKLLDFGFAKCLDGLGESSYAGSAYRASAWFAGLPRAGEGASRHGASRHGASCLQGDPHQGDSLHGVSRHGDHVSSTRFYRRMRPSAPPEDAGAPAGDRESRGDRSVHNVSPKGSRLYAAPVLTADPACRKNGSLLLTREEALQLDAYSLGKILRYMLTGASPNQSVLEAIADEQSASCLGCVLLRACGRRRPARCILEPERLSKQSRDMLEIFTRHADRRFTVVDVRAHEWLLDESVHGAQRWAEASPTPSQAF